MPSKTKPSRKLSRRDSWRYGRVKRGEAFRHGFVFTLGGGAYIGICFVVGLAAANTQINLLFLVFGIVLGGLLVSGTLSTLTLAGLRVTRQMPVTATAGQFVPILYRVVNRKPSLASYSLHVREHLPPADCSETYLPTVPGRGASTQRAIMFCRRRGIYRFAGMTAYTRFPFSLFVHFARFKDADEMLVFPAVGRLARDAIGLIYRAGATSQRPLDRRGGEEEFFGLREYRHGDNPRWIHWRRSARLGTPVVREMSPPMPRRLMVAVSARAADDWKEGREDPLLEQALSLAASVITDAIGQAFEVGLVIAQKELVWFPATRGQHQRFDMMRALALLEPGQPTPLGNLPRQCLRHLAGSQCLWITCGLETGEVLRQVDALAALNITVQPMAAEQVDFDRLLRLPQVDQSLLKQSKISSTKARPARKIE